MLKIDLHIHSINSGHAYGTYYSIAKEAARKKMKLIAITDHGPNMIGTNGFIHFKMANRAPKVIDGVRVLWGCEANVINGKGEIDLNKECQEEVELLSVGFHRGSGYEDLGKEKNTEAMKKALQNPKVKIFTHPTHCQFDCDFEDVCNCALDNNVLLEINENYLGESDAKKLQEFKTMVDMAKERGKKLVLGSDAHFLHEIGEDNNIKKYWKEIGLSKEIIINNYPKELMDFLGLENNLRQKP